MTDLLLLPVDPAHIGRIDELLMTAYEAPSRRADLEVYVQAQPDGIWAFWQEDDPVAAAAAFAYGSFSWLGLVATHPGYRGLGLASRLSEHLVRWALQRGCATVALDATPAGERVYAKLGFEQVGWTAEYHKAPVLHEAPDSGAVRRAAGNDLNYVCRLDRRVFGGDRSKMLALLLRDGRYRCHVATADGACSGFAFAHDGSVGPAAALDERAAGLLLAAAGPLPGEEPARLIVPLESAYTDAVVEAGWTLSRRLAHMRYGSSTLPGERRRLLGQLSFATG